MTSWARQQTRSPRPSLTCKQTTTLPPQQVDSHGTWQALRTATWSTCVQNPAEYKIISMPYNPKPLSP